MRSEASTPAEYVASVAPEWQPAVKQLRRVLRANLPKGFKETVDYGMLAYVVPHRLYPPGYHCDPAKPLPFMNLASQKQYVSVYHMGLYDAELLGWLRGEWRKHTAAKLDLGRCCLRLRKLDDLPLELIGELASQWTPQEWIARYQAVRSRG